MNIESSGGARIFADKKSFESIIEKYPSIPRIWFEKEIARICKSYSNKTQQSLEKNFGFENGEKHEFIDRIKDFVLLVNDNYQELEKMDYVEFWTFKELKALKFKKDDYIINPLLKPKEISLWYGASEEFKSLFCQYLASCISSGSSVLGKFETKQCAVGYLDKEEIEQTQQSRFVGLCKGLNKRNLKKLHILKSDFLGFLDKKGWRDELIRQIRRLDIKILFVDTMHRFGNYQENSSDEINSFYLNALNPIRKETDCHIALIHHSTKKGDFRGSSDIMGMLDAMFLVKKDKYENVWINHKKNRSGAKISPICIKPIFQKGIIRFELKSDVEQITKARITKSDKLEEEILKNLSSKETTRAELKKLLKVKPTESMLTRVLNFLEVTNKIKKISKGVYSK